MLELQQVLVLVLLLVMQLVLVLQPVQLLQLVVVLQLVLVTHNSLARSTHGFPFRLSDWDLFLLDILWEVYPKVYC